MRHSSDGISIDQVAIAILRQDEALVMVQQQAGPDTPPYWVLPGGLVEAGELIVEGLRREAREEAGVVVESIAHLACCCHIDRPALNNQVLALIFEIDLWHGPLQIQDPDGEVLAVEITPLAEAIHRLATNGGWPGIQTPLLAYLRGEAGPGSAWFYREEAGVQRLLASVLA
jgi:8-oxo-dGTP diphosphatase